jgi:hypothetical protein
LTERLQPEPISSIENGWRATYSASPNYMGHRSATITELYAELDQQKALEAIVRVG